MSTNAFPALERDHAANIDGDYTAADFLAGWGAAIDREQAIREDTATTDEEGYETDAAGTFRG